LVKLSFLKKGLSITYNLNIQLFAGFPDNFLGASATLPSNTFPRYFGKRLCDRPAKTPYAGHGHDEDHTLLPFPSSLPLHPFFIDHNP